MKKIKLIDCTLREIGYQTMWNFSDDCIQKIYNFANENNMYCIEIGFCHDSQADFGKGKLRYCGEDFINIKNKRNTLVAAMKDIERPSANILKKEFTNIDIIRIMTRSNETDFNVLINNVEEVKKLGYDFFVNFTNAGENSRKRNMEIIKFSKESGISQIVFADTKSVMNENQVKELIYICHCNDISVGMHFHDKNGIAKRLTEIAIKENVDYLDVTHLGLGGKFLDGNLPVDYLIARNNDMEKIEKLLREEVEVYNIKSLYEKYQ